MCCNIIYLKQCWNLQIEERNVIYYTYLYISPSHKELAAEVCRSSLCDDNSLRNVVYIL